MGQNLQDHVYFGCIWEYAAPIVPRNTGNDATLFWKSSPELSAPDLLFCQAEFPVPSPQTAARGVPADEWTMFAGLSRPKSRGRVRLRTADPLDHAQPPLGRVASAEGTPFDFRHPAAVGASIRDKNAQLAIANGYDQYWVLEKQGDPAQPQHAVPAVNLASGRTLDCYTTEPGVQIFTADC